MKITLNMRTTYKRTCTGFSLIEMIVAITVLGILSTSAAVFLRGPITSYFDAERRADLSDAGGLAMAKLGLDISGTTVTDVTVLPPPPGGGFSFLIAALPAAPVTYICSVTTRTLRRVTGVQNNLLANGVWNCQVHPLVPGNIPLGGLVAVELNLRSEDAAGNDMGDRLNLIRTFRVGRLQ
jgi:prepilin-type N-terminal cleavage/methylation domain-containing protein